jgi:GT2 family glycosyltransferase
LGAEPAPPRRATAIVLAWNRWDLTEKCIRTFRETVDPADADLLVVDNGSADETPRRLAEMKGLRTIRNAKNLGFVRGNNVGIAAADSSTDILLLNNDMEFRSPGWIPRLREAAYREPDVGIVGCRLVLPDGRLLHAGTYVLPDTLWGQQIGSLEKDVLQYVEDREVEGIVFACAYIRREVIDRVGGLSLDYQSYFEDTDYCLRARDAGFRTICCGEVTLIHDEHGSTAGNDELFRKIFQKSQKRFGRRWKSKLESRYRRELHWQSLINFPTGYAMSSRELLRALDAEGVHLSYRYVFGPGTKYPIREREGSGDYLLNVISARKVPAHPAVSVVYGLGDAFCRSRGKRKIGFTMLEVNGFPQEWVDQANRMDEIWVPSEFNRQGFLDSGLKRPVHVVPLGVDPDHFHPRIRRHPNPLGDFLFFSSFEWGERKSPEVLLQSFNRTFRREEPVMLLCKVMNSDTGVRVKDAIEALGLRAAGGRIEFLFNTEMPYTELGSLYRSADCFVSAGRGEGWDMPLMEAMACGLPTIATDWGAHREFVHDGISYPLHVRRLIPAVAKCPYYAPYSWADPDDEHLDFLLRHVYENRDEAASRGSAAAAQMRARWTWRHAARRIVARLEEGE